MQMNPNGFATHCLKTFLDQCAHQVGTRPTRESIPGLARLLLDQLLQFGFTSAIHFWDDAQCEGGPPVRLNHPVRIGQTNTEWSLH